MFKPPSHRAHATKRKHAAVHIYMKLSFELHMSNIIAFIRSKALIWWPWIDIYCWNVQQYWPLICCKCCIFTVLRMHGILTLDMCDIHLLDALLSLRCYQTCGCFIVFSCKKTHLLLFWKIAFNQHLRKPCSTKKWQLALFYSMRPLLTENVSYGGGFNYLGA